MEQKFLLMSLLLLVLVLQLLELLFLHKLLLVARYILDNST